MSGSSLHDTSDEYLDINHTLVCGYTRRMQSALCTKTVIPTEVIKICCLFYKNLFKIFMYSAVNMKINVLHIKKKQISKILLPNLKKFVFCKPLCYVNNITLGMNICSDIMVDIDYKKCYDAIISVEALRGKSRLTYYNKTNYHSNIMLFKSSKIEHKAINYISFQSKHALPVDCNTIGYKYGAHHFIYCGINNGIIYEFDGDLYQLKLSNINIESKDYNFTKIKIKQKHFWDHTNHNDFPQYLSMKYLKNMNKLFTIKCQWKKRHSFNLKATEENVKCAIFDLKQSEWKVIETLNIKNKPHFGYYAHEICHNQYDTNLIYAVSNSGHTAKYDFVKNKWNVLTDNCLSLKPYNKHIVWMDNPHILYCSDGTYFGFFDCRNNKQQKWNKMDHLINTANNLSDPCPFL